MVLDNLKVNLKVKASHYIIGNISKNRRQNPENLKSFLGLKLKIHSWN